MTDKPRDAYDEKADYIKRQLDGILWECRATDSDQDKGSSVRIIAAFGRACAAEEADFAALASEETAKRCEGMPVTQSAFLSAAEQFRARAAALREPKK